MEQEAWEQVVLRLSKTTLFIQKAEDKVSLDVFQTYSFKEIALPSIPRQPAFVCTMLPTISSGSAPRYVTRCRKASSSPCSSLAKRHLHLHKLAPHFGPPREASVSIPPDSCFGTPLDALGQAAGQVGSELWQRRWRMRSFKGVLL